MNGIRTNKGNDKIKHSEWLFLFASEVFGLCLFVCHSLLQVHLFESIRPLFVNKPVLIGLNKVRITNSLSYYALQRILVFRLI